MPVDHYENFPVASLLLPAALRQPIEAIYAFARSADDVADEGDAQPEQRLTRLDDYRRELQRLEHRKPPLDPELAPIFTALTEAVARHQLPLQPFHDLLDAFSQDVVKTRYADFAELQDYCRRSANPVGRLLLALYRADDAERVARSDQICTALQLINFWQDVAVDWNKQRIYLPLDEMAHFGVSEMQLREQQCDAAFRALMAFQVERAREMMLTGAPLARQLPGRMGWELRLVVLGGLAILERLEAAGYDVFRVRPVLRRKDWLGLAWRAIPFRIRA